MKLLISLLFLLTANSHAQIKVKKDNYRGAVVITPNDNANLTDPVSAIYVGGSGNIRLVTLAGDQVVVSSTPIGILEIGATKIFSTSTTATGLIGLK
jgi:hypothetical protein